MVSLFHAYSFTHPITQEKSFFYPTNGMQLTKLEKIKATFFGIRPIKKVNTIDPSYVTLDFEAIEFYSRDNIIIRGWLIKGDPIKPTVIVAHGYLTDKASLLPIIKMLHEQGFTVLAFDFRGVGSSNGTYISFGFYEKNDVLSAVDFLKKREDIVSDEIYGYGVSMGAAALVFAEEEESHFDGLILDSCYTDLYQNVGTRFKEVYGFPKFPFATALTFFGGLVLGTNGFTISPMESISNINIPILIIQSENDNSVLLEEGRALFLSANEPKYFWIVDNAKHANAYNEYPQKYESAVFSFFNDIANK